MDADRKHALWGGIFYLLTFATSIPAVFLLDPILNDTNYVLGAGSEGRVMFAGILDVLVGLTGIGTAVALYPVVKRQNHAAALGFVTARMYEAAVIMIGVVCLFAVVTLRQEAVAADDATLTVLGQSLVAVRDWTFVLGPGVAPGLSALLLGYLLYRSGLVPRWMPLMGLIGAPLFLAARVGTIMAGDPDPTVFGGVTTVPIAVWELSIGIWLTFKGFLPSPVTTGNGRGAHMSTGSAELAEVS
jgi:hypothetical protein